VKRTVTLRGIHHRSHSDQRDQCAQYLRRITEIEAWGVAAGGTANAQAWSTFGRDAQHTALSTTASQPLNRVVWQMPVDLQPQYSGNGSLLSHYGSPLMTASNTVVVPVKTGATGGFRVEARAGSSGALQWSMDSDYVMPAHNWVLSFGPALSSQSRVYFPGAGGRVYFRDQAMRRRGRAVRSCSTGSRITRPIRPRTMRPSSSTRRSRSILREISTSVSWSAEARRWD
jgi:hypothetical protein